MIRFARQSLMLLLSIPVVRAADTDFAIEPAHVIVAPSKQHIPPTKRQGVPAIERTAQGRLSAARSALPIQPCCIANPTLSGLPYQVPCHLQPC